MTHESDDELLSGDEQLINLLKNNKKHSILLMKTDEGSFQRKYCFICQSLPAWTRQFD
mgnify:CR=1 FL=1|jgi:hypothetical protein